MPAAQPFASGNLWQDTTNSRTACPVRAHCNSGTDCIWDRYRALQSSKLPASGRAIVLRLCGTADALIEGFRPGVMERLGLGLNPDDLPEQSDVCSWPAVKEQFRSIFLTRSSDEWMAVFAGTDACVAPVLTTGEAALHPHNAARGAFRKVAGVLQAGPAPRFSRTAPEIETPPPEVGAHTEEILAEKGFSAREIDALREAGIIA